LNRKRDRYREGVRRPRPATLEKIRAAMLADPGASRRELARRCGISRTTLTYYLRAVGDRLPETMKMTDDARDREVLGFLDVLAEFKVNATEIRGEIRKLQSLPLDPATSAAIFRGFEVLGRQLALAGTLVLRR
jgi:hypothetical protein